MEISKSDMEKVVKYLNDAAKLCDSHKGQRFVCRAWCLRNLANKLNKKIIKLKTNDNIP